MGGGSGGGLACKPTVADLMMDEWRNMAEWHEVSVFRACRDAIHRVSQRIHRVSQRIHCVSQRIHRVSQRIHRVSQRIHRVSIGIRDIFHLIRRAFYGRRNFYSSYNWWCSRRDESRLYNWVKSRYVAECFPADPRVLFLSPLSLFIATRKILRGKEKLSQGKLKLSRG